ncbi:MAG: hypothetical protein QNJ64_16730 [Crocosphaera sp.]|nr:hypothetical protein [Crocosphaera sp.]
MKLIYKVLSLREKSKTNTGYTVTELLIGLSLGSLVVAVAGFGLVNTLLLDQKASAKGTMQYNTDRSLEFIAEEVKLGRKVEADAVGAVDEVPEFTLPNRAKPILALRVPNVPRRIFYYIKPASDVWLGSYVIERWGPNFNTEGQYEESEINNPETWESHVLMDNIDDTSITPNCPPDWQSSNPDAPRGFNVCVDPTERLVKMNLATTDTNPTWKNDLNYEASMMAFTRSNIVQGFSENAPSFTISNKQLILDGAANVKFQVLGGEITCGSGGADIPVKTNLYVDGNEETWNTNSFLELANQPAGTTFDVESVAGDGSSCDGHEMTVSSAQTNNPQLQVLVNGDPVPDLTPFDNQNTIEFFMQQYVKDGKIKIAENQAIFLFELWGDNQSASYFDLQDNVVLATVENAN